MHQLVWGIPLIRPGSNLHEIQASCKLISEGFNVNYDHIIEEYRVCKKQLDGELGLFLRPNLHIKTKTIEEERDYYKKHLDEMQDYLYRRDSKLLSILL